MSLSGDLAPGLTVAALVLASAGFVSTGRRRPQGGSGAARRWRPTRPGWWRRGRSPAPDADEAAAEVAQRAAALLRAGLSPDQAWRHATDPTSTPAAADQTAALQAVWRLLTQTGAPAVQALDAVAAGLREDAAARAAVRTGLAGAKVSARTVSALPVLGLVLGAALGAEPWDVLLGTVPGRISAVLGVALLLLGRWWSARLVRRAGADP